MVKSYKTQSFFCGLKFSCANVLKTNRLKIAISVVAILVAIFTGVFVAIKTDSCDFSHLQEIDFNSFYSGVAASASAFFQRCLSLLINVGLLWVLSLSPFLFPLALSLFVYRAYLFGLNFAFIFIFYGLGSIFTAVVIILPCQLATLFAFVIFYLILQRMNVNCKNYGRAEISRPLFVLIGLLLFVLINLIESLLLCILSGQVIMVI